MPRNRYYHGPPSDHLDGVRFFNPGQLSTDRGPTAMLRWKLAGGAAKWPEAVPVTSASPEAPKLALASALSAASIAPRRFVAATPGVVYDYSLADAG